MTKKEFAKTMISLACAYKRSFALNLSDNEEVKDTVMDNWYEFFKDYRTDAFEQIAREWIEDEDKAPLIKDLKHKTRQLSNRLDKEDKEGKKENTFSLPTEFDFRQTADSKRMTYAEWIKENFGVSVDEIQTV